VVKLLNAKEGQEAIIETMSKLKPQYVTDENGKKTAVILPINEYEELIEDIQDLAVLAERREEPPISHGEVVAKLKQDGYL
jgi:PHD/YefM family antitoxin component YafN of YafNO toxin-antitoxin module